MAHPLVHHWKRDGAAVYIGRPGPWGNPFRLHDESEREMVLGRYRAWLNGCDDLKRMARRYLAGKTLGCWCAPRLCHGDVLATVANDGMPAHDPVFVFGSNTAARHGKGGALFAVRHRDASCGIASGRCGRSYAIPTKDDHLRALPLSAIQADVARFLDHARSEPGTDFDVTAIGCGLAGYRDDDVAPMFAHAPANCRLPYKWQRLLNPALPARVIVAGSRTFADPGVLASKLDALLARHPDAWIVSGGAKGADVLGEDYAVDRGRGMIRVPADWDRYGRAAGMIRNQHMSFLASHAIVFWDGASRGTRSMIEIAKADRLPLRIVRV